MDFINTYIEYNENVETCDDYKTWCAISAIAACLQRRAVLQLGHINIYPNMYIALVGAPGKARKGTAITPYRKLLEDAGITMCGESITTAKLIGRMKMATTIDSIVDENGNDRMFTHSSLTLIAPELSVFLGYQEKKFLANLSDWWDSNRFWRYETVGRGEETIEGVWFNFLGGITPDLLQSSLPQDAVGGGLLSRMILVYAETRGKIILFPEITPKQLELQEVLLNMINDLTLVRGVYTLSKATKDFYSDWRKHTLENPRFHQASLIGYNERRAVHLLKLCIIVNASHQGNMLISLEDFERALTLLEHVEEGMPYALRGMGARDDRSVVVKIMQLIESEKMVSESKLYRTFLYDARKETIDEIIETCRTSGVIKIMHDKETKELFFKWIKSEQ